LLVKEKWALFDTNESRLVWWRPSMASQAPVLCTILTLDGRPVAGAVFAWRFYWSLIEEATALA
jgi:hypothetical protein